MVIAGPLHRTPPTYRTWSSGSVPEVDQFAFWADVVRDVFGPMRVAREDSGAFHTEITQANIGALVVSSVEAGPHTAERDSALAQLDTSGRVYINIPRSGELAGEQNSRSIRPREGTVGMISSGVVTKIHAPVDFRQFVIGLPAELITPRLADPTAAGTASGMLPGLLSHMVDYLFEHAEGFSVYEAGQVTQQVVDLVVASFGPSTSYYSGRSAILLQAAMDHAEATLDQASLGTDSLAAHVNVSRRTLEKLFAERGTTAARWILQRRLERARLDLASAAHARNSIETIAQRWGFVDRTHFSRVFKSHFGESPAAFRRGH